MGNKLECFFVGYALYADSVERDTDKAALPLASYVLSGIYYTRPSFSLWPNSVCSIYIYNIRLLLVYEKRNQPALCPALPLWYSKYWCAMLHLCVYIIVCVCFFFSAPQHVSFCMKSVNSRRTGKTRPTDMYREMENVCRRRRGI